MAKKLLKWHTLPLGQRQLNPLRLCWEGLFSRTYDHFKRKHSLIVPILTHHGYWSLSRHCQTWVWTLWLSPLQRRSFPMGGGTFKKGLKITLSLWQPRCCTDRLMRFWVSLWTEKSGESLQVTWDHIENYSITNTHLPVGYDYYGNFLYT